MSEGNTAVINEADRLIQEEIKKSANHPRRGLFGGFGRLGRRHMSTPAAPVASSPTEPILLAPPSVTRNDLANDVDANSFTNSLNDKTREQQDALAEQFVIDHPDKAARFAPVNADLAAALAREKAKKEAVSAVALPSPVVPVALPTEPVNSEPPPISRNDFNNDPMTDGFIKLLNNKTKEQQGVFVDEFVAENPAFAERYAQFSRDLEEALKRKKTAEAAAASPATTTAEPVSSAEPDHNAEWKTFKNNPDVSALVGLLRKTSTDAEWEQVLEKFGTDHPDLTGKILQSWEAMVAAVKAPEAERSENILKIIGKRIKEDPGGVLKGVALGYIKNLNILGEENRNAAYYSALIASLGINAIFTLNTGGASPFIKSGIRFAVSGGSFLGARMSEFVQKRKDAGETQEGIEKRTAEFMEKYPNAALNLRRAAKGFAAGNAFFSIGGLANAIAETTLHEGVGKVTWGTIQSAVEDKVHQIHTPAKPVQVGVAMPTPAPVDAVSQMPPADVAATSPWPSATHGAVVSGGTPSESVTDPLYQGTVAPVDKLPVVANLSGNGAVSTSNAPIDNLATVESPGYSSGVIAAEVGNKLPPIRKEVADMLQQQGIGQDSPVYAQAQKAAQKAMENIANHSFEQAATAGPGDSLADITAKGKEIFEKALENPATQLEIGKPALSVVVADQLAHNSDYVNSLVSQAATQAVDHATSAPGAGGLDISQITHQAIVSQLGNQHQAVADSAHGAVSAAVDTHASAISSINEQLNNPSVETSKLFYSVSIKPGDTMSSLISPNLQSGMDLYSSDYYNTLLAEVAANPDIFKVDPKKLYDIMVRLQDNSSDEVAIAQLNEIAKIIPSGGSVKMLTPDAVVKILDILKNTKQ